jgi:hypothetical protein
MTCHHYHFFHAVKVKTLFAYRELLLYDITLTAQKMVMTITHQMSIFKIQKQVKNPI